MTGEMSDESEYLTLRGPSQTVGTVMSDTYLGHDKSHLAMICRGSFATYTSLILNAKPAIRAFLLLIPWIN